MTRPKLAVVLAGLAIVYAAMLHGMLFAHAAPSVWADACAYLSAARGLATEGTFAYRLVQLNPQTLESAPEFGRVGWWPPMYPAAIAALAAGYMDDPEALLTVTAWLNAVGGMVAVAALCALLWMTTGDLVVGLLGGAAYALCAPVVSEAPRILSEHLFIPLALIGLVLQFQAAQKGRWWWCVAAGVVWGLACLTRHSGLVILLCGAAASWISLRHVPALGRAGRISPAVLIALAMWGAWALRNYCIAGRAIGGHYAPGSGDLVAEAITTLYAYAAGMSTSPWSIALVPHVRTWLAGITTAALLLGWGGATAGLVASRRPEAFGDGRRWLLWFGCLCVAATLCMVLLAETARHINLPSGRLMLPACIGTIAAFGAICRHGHISRAAVAVLLVCVLLGGTELAASRLMAPSADAFRQPFRILHADKGVRDLVRGKRILLTGTEALGPAVRLVPASIYLPSATTIYWIDNPEYTGVVIGPEEAATLIRDASVDLILVGPSVDDQLSEVYASTPAPSGFGSDLSRRLLTDALHKTKRSLNRLHRYSRPLGAPTRVVLRAGGWQFLEVMPLSEESAHGTGREARVDG